MNYSFTDPTFFQDRQELEASYRDDLRDKQEEIDQLRADQARIMVDWNNAIGCAARHSEAEAHLRKVLKSEAEYIADLEDDAHHMDSMYLTLRDRYDALEAKLLGKIQYVNGRVAKMNQALSNDLEAAYDAGKRAFFRYSTSVGG